MNQSESKNENSITKRLKKALSSFIKSKTFAAILIILITEVIFFYPVFFKGEVISSDIHLRFYPYNSFTPKNLFFDSELKSDMMDSYYPQMELYTSALKAGETPYWENNSGFGEPRDTIFGWYYPLEYLSTIIPIEINLTIITLLKVFICAIGMYLFLKELKLRHYPSLFGALVYTYSGFNIVWLWGHAATVGCLLPLLLYSTTKILNKNYKYSVLLILTSALMLSTGFIAGAGHALYLVIFFTIAHLLRLLLQKLKKVRPNLYTIKHTFINLRPYLLIAFSIIIGVSFVIFTLLPTLDFLNFQNTFSYRKEVNADAHFTLKKVLPQLVFPYFNGGVLAGKYFGEANYNETSGYIGLVGIFFMMLGALSIPLRRAKLYPLFFLLVNLFTLSVIFKIGPTLDFIKNFPIFDSSSNTRLLMWLAFSGSILAAYGFDGILTLKNFAYKLAEKKKSRIFVFVTLLFTAVLSAMYLIKGSSFTPIFTATGINFITYKIMLLSVSIVFVYIIFVLTFILIFNKKISLNIPALIIFLTFIELFTYGLHQTPMIPRNLFFPKTEGIAFLENNTDKVERIMAFDGTFATRGAEQFHDLFIPLNHGLYSQPQKDYIQQAYKDPKKIWLTPTAPRNDPTNVKYDSKILDELNIKYLVFRPTQTFTPEDQKILEENFKLAYSKQGDLKIYENKSGYSLGHFDHGSGEIKPVKVTNNTEIFEVTATEDTIFYVSEAYYPNWKAKLNEQNTEVLNHKNIWRAVKVKKGKNTVEFNYIPSKVYRYGKVYTITANILILIGFAGYILSRIKSYK